MMTNHSQVSRAVTSRQETEQSEGVDQARKKLIEASLCANCRHLWECVFPMKATDPIFECELHECGASVTPRLILLKTKKDSREESEGAGDNEPLGLCTNCENLPDCHLPKNPGGVWHCEEYE